MKKMKYGFAALAALAMTACGGGSDGDRGGDSADVPLAQAPAMVQQFAAAFNAARAVPRNCGQQAMQAAPTLTKWNPKLQEAAQTHANDMAAKNYFAHERRDGKNLTDFGYQGGVGEILARTGGGGISPSAVTAAWLRSPGHCAAVMNPAFKTLAVGQNSLYSVGLLGE